MESRSLSKQMTCHICSYPKFFESLDSYLFVANGTDKSTPEVGHFTVQTCDHPDLACMNNFTINVVGIPRKLRNGKCCVGILEGKKREG
jgi:hypothetical protein